MPLGHAVIALILLAIAGVHAWRNQTQTVT
jgi:hypothetical protein